MTDRPAKNERTRCNDCGATFDMPDPVHNVIYVPERPRFNSVVAGYEDQPRQRERAQEGQKICESWPQIG